jgi:eukaryotic-like serine/threonine-protein kinase
VTDLGAQIQNSLGQAYTIERELGRGGMATVFLARDHKHDRLVALKVLDPELGAVLGGERFLSEIRVTANLQHPNLLPLFDSGSADGFLYYVMPYVEGETLRHRLERERQLPVDEALRIATAIAGALDYAHGHGVIHRDLKPENILLQHGQPVVADFGIALAVSNAGGTRITQTGLSLGTPQYMSPEQATGDRVIDARSDIYSLGAITYEMLVGEPPHIGQTAQAIIARVLTETPRTLTAARPTVPVAVEHAVLRSLEKLPADRWSSALEFAEALNGGAAVTRVVATGRPRMWSLRSPVPWAAALVVTLLAAFTMRGGSMTAVHGAMRFALQPPPGVTFDFPAGGVSWLALSPDGKTLVYSANEKDYHGLWIQRIGELEAKRVPGGDYGRFPAISPDGKWLAFVNREQTIRRVGLDGSGASTVFQSKTGVRGITWTSPTEVVFASTQLLEAHGLWRVRAEGGTPERLAFETGGGGRKIKLSPQASADGRFVFYSATVNSVSDLELGVVDMKDGTPHIIEGANGASALALIDGVLYYVQADGALMAAVFNQKMYSLGTPLEVADSVAINSSVAAAAISAAGQLVYARGGLSKQLVRVDDRGAVSRVFNIEGAIFYPRISPDGRRVVYQVQGADASEIWVADLTAGTRERITQGERNDRPEWTPDGRSVIYSTRRGEAMEIWSKPIDGSAPATLVVADSDPVREAVISRDGKSLLYRADRGEAGRDIYLKALPDGSREMFAGGPGDQLMPRFSPNSQWAAYLSTESGRDNVYVRARDGHARLMVSEGEGLEPLWSPDGTRVLYRSGRSIVAATLSLSSDPSVVRRDTILADLFELDGYHANWDVYPDGKHFMFTRADEANLRQILVLDWLPEVRARLKAVR